MIRLKSILDAFELERVCLLFSTIGTLLSNSPNFMYLLPLPKAYKTFPFFL